MSAFRYLDVCSGISAPSQAWLPLGWQAAAYSEIEKFPRAVLAERYGAVPVGPDHRFVAGSNITPLFGDFTQIEAHHVGPIDLLVGGTPCQDFSIAGLRAGLAGDRGNLSLEYLRLADRTRPRWLVWENVPGVLSQDGGRAFGAILGGMGELGYGFAYRVLDAQHFGVPQRRRRVFVVGHIGDWRRAAAVLFERHSLSGDTAPRRETRTVVAALTANGVGTCGADDNQGQAGHLIAAGIGNNGETARSLTASHTATGRLDPNECRLICAHVAPCLDANYGRLQGHDNQHIDGGAGLFVTSTLTSNGDAHSGFRDDAGLVPIAFQSSQSGVRVDDVHATLDSNNGSRRHNGVIADWAVRRLTPRECERLQGFPDDFTAITYRGKPAADGPRYKALGNSMAVPCMAYIGQRIAAVDALHIDVSAAA